jgi:hypothetical protein
MDAQIILKIKANSQKTITNFGYYSIFIMEMMEKEGYHLIIEQIQDGAVLFFEDKKSYIGFHEKSIQLLKLLPRKTNLNKIKHTETVVLEITEIKMKGLDKETWTRLFLEVYQQIYKEIKREITTHGCILSYTGEVKPSLNKIMKK